MPEPVENKKANIFGSRLRGDDAPIKSKRVPRQGSNIGKIIERQRPEIYQRQYYDNNNKIEEKKPRQSSKSLDRKNSAFSDDLDKVNVDIEDERFPQVMVMKDTQKTFATKSRFQKSMSSHQVREADSIPDGLFSPKFGMTKEIKFSEIGKGESHGPEIPIRQENSRVGNLINKAP